VSDIRFHVNRYIEEGLVVLPVQPGEKATRLKNWQQPETRSTLEDFDANSNVALRLDDIVDVDCDCDETREMGATLLLHTDRRHGRPSRGITHYWFRAPGSKDKETFRDVDGKMLVEIRTGNKQYTLLPPSSVLVNKDDPSQGFEELYWDRDVAANTVDAAGLRRSVVMLATAALVARHWPRGERHNTLLHLAGFLARHLDAKETEQVLLEITRVAEGQAWSEIPGLVRSTYAKQDDGKTTGAPSLGKALDPDVAKLLQSWYGRSSKSGGGLSEKEIDALVEEMNRVHFYTRIGKDTVVATERPDGELVFATEKALYSWYANQKVVIGKHVVSRGERKGEEDVKTRSRFEIWREHENRRQYRGITFAPYPRQAHPEDYNLWRGLAVQPADGPHDLFLGHLKDNLCSGHEGHYEYLLDYLAFTVQNPGRPAEVAVVLKGGMGTGKGIFIRNFGALFGRHYVQLDRAEHLTGKFNASISGKVVVFADEAFFAGDKAHLGTLKRITTEPTLQIERKGIDPIYEPNNIHLFMATNEDWALPAGFQERRFFVLNVSDQHLQDLPYFQAIQDQLDAGGLAGFLKMLLARSVTHARVRQAPRTDELRVQQEMSMAHELKWWKECLALGQIAGSIEWPDRLNTQTAYADYIAWCDRMKVNYRRISIVDMSRRVLRPWMGTLHKVRENGAFVRSYQLLGLQQARELFDKVAGTTTPWDDEGQPIAGHEAQEPEPQNSDPLPF
jgi:hypothetical protein